MIAPEDRTGLVGLLGVSIDNDDVFLVDDTTTGYDTYNRVVIPIPVKFQDNDVHQFVIYSSIDGDLLSFIVDLVQLETTGNFTLFSCL
jgi:hypothetical protein